MKPRHYLLGLLAAVAGLAVAFPAAAQKHTFTTDAQFDTGLLNNVVHTPTNQLQLGPTPVSKTTLVWVDNYVPGWIVRIDSSTGRQTARFDSALQFINGQATGARPSKENCNWANLGNCPGRVAVDTNGDVWIVNRAFGQQGTLSKFSGNIGHCIDRNNNGLIDTSRDANNDGIVNPADPAEYLGPNDECILTTIPVGGIGHCPRSVAVDKKGKIWVGTCCGGYQIFRFNPNEPVALEKTIQMPAGSCMYSAASGGDYVFFSNRHTNGTIRVHIDTLAVQYAPCGAETYGVVADPGGGHAWLGGYSQAYVRRADFTTTPPSCQSFPMPAMVTAMTLDLQGNVWASGYGNATVSKLSPTGTILGTYPTGASGPHGLSVDFQGNIWSVHDGAPHLVKFSPSGQNLGAFSIASSTGGYDYTPYLYSDFTGVQINRIAPFTRLGIWEGTYDGGATGIPWSAVSWNAEPQGAVPVETSLAISVRAADSLSELATQPYALCQNGAPMFDTKGRFVQTKVDFQGPGYKTPVLSDLSVQGPCSTLGEFCCVKDQDCNDSNPCTFDACMSGTCLHTPQPGCCMSNSDCDDGEACTADLCSGLGGSCSNVQINGCCMTDEDCTKGNICSDSTCPAPGGLCNIKYKDNCCKTDDDCADTDLCTTDACDLTTNKCSNTPIVGCCNKDPECFDNDECTKDTCSSAGGTCKFEPVLNCCTPTSPQVGQPCDEPVSPFDHPPCAPGHWQCDLDSKELKCVGAIKPTEEACDWKDNNCDGNIDEASCPVGTTCINGVCAKPCKSGEFPCEAGFTCKDGVCLPQDCTKVICAPGWECVSGECVGEGGAAGGAGSAGTAGAAGAAGGAGSGTDGGTTADGSAASGGEGGSGQAGSAGAAGAAGKPGKTAPENFAQTTGGGGCTCEAAGSRSAAGWQLWAASALAALAFARRRQRKS